MATGFYDRRQYYADAIGACVLCDPNCTPSRELLPRAELHDEDLQRLLCLSVRSGQRFSVLLRLAWRELRGYVLRLVELMNHYRAKFPAWPIWPVECYATDLRRCYELESRRVELLKEWQDLKRRRAEL